MENKMNTKANPAVAIVKALFTQATVKEDAAFSAYYAAKKFGKKAEAEALRKEWQMAQVEANTLYNVLKHI